MVVKSVPDALAALAALAWRATPATCAERWSAGEWRRTRHLEYLDQLLMPLAQRKPLRLIVTVPPRHGKSELVSHWLPVWYLANWPSRRVMLASYEATFAASWGRKVRNTLLQNPVIGVRLAQDSASQAIWETTESGGMVTAGVGGPITGRGADLLLIDDPIKNAQEAASPVVRESIWDWWQRVARPRLEPGAAVVVMMARWHQDDPVGRLLREGAERWQVVDLPALAEVGDVLGRQVGEPLWPERYPLSALLALQREVGPEAWAALYQQRPTAQGAGLYFDASSLERLRQDVRLPVATREGIVHIWRSPVVGRRYVAGGDLAWGEKGAYSCLRVLDWQTSEVVAEILGRPSPDDMALAAVRLCREYGDAYAGVERNGEGVVVVEKMVQLGYGGRMFYADHDSRRPERPGWQTTPATRPVMLGELEEAIRTGQLREPCGDAVREYGTFVRGGHPDPGPAQGCYSDHVMATAIAIQMRKHARFGVLAGARPPQAVYQW